MTIEESLQQGIGLAGQGMLHQALSIFEDILKDCPDEPRVLFNAAVINNRLGCKDRALILLQRSIAVDSSFANPYYYLGQLYLQNGCYQEAYQAFRNTIARDIEFTSAYEGARTAASAMGLSVIADESDVIFYTGGYPFHGRTIEEKGLGGSESALIYIARALAAKGIKVRVFCNCEKPGTYDGVRYDDLVDFHIYRNLYKLPVLISSRSMRPFKIDLQAQLRILWIHDDINVPFMEGECPSRLPIDHIFAISHWQRDLWSRHFSIPAERFFLTRNGVDVKLFKPIEKRNRNRLIYVSRPDRGLNVLLKLFPYIRQRVPDAELHIYTYQLPDDNLDDPIWQETRQPGIFMRKSLPKAALAAEVGSARLMVYPSTWKETSCIAAIEAQAAGTPVIASALAALSETVVDGVSGCLIPGDPNTAEFGRQFVETVVGLMNNDEAWQHLSRGARRRVESLYDWDTLAKEWIIEIQRLVDTKNAMSGISE
ncbi:MAG TPA: glycosyltransferase [Candidatus Wunengus sp. YC61]|uniref:glycosyltransferase n=1 Tax=Candidatus Wunengus sp. YC61 TaxID=3367698 RepID=UPI0040252E3B